MTNEVALTPKSKLLNEVSVNLTTLLEQNAKALPKNFNQTRFIQNCITVLNDTKNIDKCTPLSVSRTMIKGAYLGLDFFRKECYAIPYEVWENKKPTGVHELNFQTDYKGEKKLCMQYSERPILDIYARVVKEGDDFDCGIKDGKQYLNYNPKEFNDGKVMGVFAVVYFKDGGMAYDVMSIKDIERVKSHYAKKNSEGQYGPSWTKSEEEMQKKTVMRRLCKVLSLNFDNAEQDKAFEDGALTTVKISDKVIDTQIVDPFDKKTAEQEVKEPPKHEALRKQLKEKFPTEEDWQIEARIKDAVGQA